MYQAIFSLTLSIYQPLSTCGESHQLKQYSPPFNLLSLIFLTLFKIQNQHFYHTSQVDIYLNLKFIYLNSIIFNLTFYSDSKSLI